MQIYFETSLEVKGMKSARKELRDEFIVNRGWKPFTVDFTLSTTQDIIQSNHGYCTLLEFYDHISENVLEPIGLHIEGK